MSAAKKSRYFWEFLGALGVAFTFFMAGFTWPKPENADVHAVSFEAPVRTVSAGVEQRIREYLSAADSDEYARFYAQFVKPYYSWKGEATREQIEQENVRYNRAYDVSECTLMDIERTTGGDDVDGGLHEYVVTCYRRRKHTGKDDLAKEVVRLRMTLDLDSEPTLITGIESLNLAQIVEPIDAPSPKESNEVK